MAALADAETVGTIIPPGQFEDRCQERAVGNPPSPGRKLPAQSLRLHLIHHRPDGTMKSSFPHLLMLTELLF
jgi:hypothetical protein